MTKSKGKQRSDQLFVHLQEISRDLVSTPDGSAEHIHPGEDDTADLQMLVNQPIRLVPDGSKTPRMKKFRFQLLHHWLIHNFQPCKAADVGGGKGLLGYLLRGSGWDVTVIDPIQQALPHKYKDILSGARVKIETHQQLPCLPAEFDVDMGRDFDLLIAMHAHGCNAKIVDAAARFGCGFVIFPCCVIDEPFYPRLGVHWLESLADYAAQKGLAIQPFRLNFKGQNIGLCYRGKAPALPSRP